MIRFIDILSMAGIKLDDYKIHCATTGKDGSDWGPLLEAFFDGRFKEWQEWQTQKNFQCKHILSLIHLGNDRWLFAGVYEVKGVKPDTWKGHSRFLYDTEQVTGLDHLTGKAVIQFNKNFRASYLLGPKYEDRLILIGLREQRMTLSDFPS